MQQYGRSLSRSLNPRAEQRARASYTGHSRSSRERACSVGHAQMLSGYAENNLAFFHLGRNRTGSDPPLNVTGEGSARRLHGCRHSVRGKKASKTTVKASFPSHFIPERGEKSAASVA